MITNYHRRTRFDPRKEPRCPACNTQRPWIGLRPCAHDRDSLAEEQFATGCCSWTCAAIFYGLVTESGVALCVCGRPAVAEGADCEVCHTDPVEDGQFVFEESLAHAVSTT